MKSQRLWHWNLAPNPSAPDALRAAADDEFGPNWDYRWALSRHKGMKGPLVHVVSGMKGSIITWTGRGSPAALMRMPLAAEAATRALERGVFVSRTTAPVTVKRSPAPRRLAGASVRLLSRS